MTRVVFMGTPEFAVPSLDALLDAGYEVAGVFTQPDRPVGRGHKTAPSPVKVRALERGCEVFQFERVRRPEGVAQLRALAPDVMVTAAFGQILTPIRISIRSAGWSTCTPRCCRATAALRRSTGASSRATRKRA